MVTLSTWLAEWAGHPQAQAALAAACASYVDPVVVSTGNTLLDSLSSYGRSVLGE